MKKLSSLFIFSCLLITCSLYIFACKPDESEANPENKTPGDTLTIDDLDDISDRLQFFGASKKTGISPAAPGGSSLKINIKDTLYLVQGIHISIRFLHEDTTENVAGAYVQVVSTVGSGGSATNFYDVPELPEVAESDTVSLFAFGFDQPVFGVPTGVPPAGAPGVFHVTITPYNENGQSLDEITIPVSVQALNDDPKGANGLGKCGLVLGPDEVWDWNESYVLNTKFANIDDLFGFYANPKMVFGAKGQDIKGCCDDGVSTYDIICASNITAQRSLRFPTFYRRKGASLTFFDNGTYLRQTFEGVANPVPEISDFCGNGPGIVEQKNIHVISNGNWTVSKFNVPEEFKDYYDNRNFLTLQTTSSTGGIGFENSGGIIHQLTCNLLLLVELDREGFGQHLYKFYQRRLTTDPNWYPTN